MRQTLRLCGKAGHGCCGQTGLRRNHVCGPLARCVWAGAGRRGHRGRRGLGGISICHGHQSPQRLRITKNRGHHDGGKRRPPNTTHNYRGGRWHGWLRKAWPIARHLHGRHFNHWRRPHHRAHNCAKLWVLGHGCIFHSCIRQGLLRLGRHSQIYSAGRQSYRKIRCRAGCGFCPLWPIKPLKKMGVFRIFYGRRPPSCSHRLGQIIRVWRWGFRHQVGTQHGCIRVRCALVWMRGKARQKGAKRVDSHARGACNLRQIYIWALQRHP